MGVHIDRVSYGLIDDCKWRNQGSKNTNVYVRVFERQETVATRGLKNNNVEYQCIKSMAELESNIDGSKSIKKLILE